MCLTLAILCEIFLPALHLSLVIEPSDFETRMPKDARQNANRTRYIMMTVLKTKAGK